MQPSLIALYHKQQQKTLKTRNSKKEGVINSGMKPKRAKTWDMKCRWLRDKEVLVTIGVHKDVITKFMRLS